MTTGRRVECHDLDIQPYLFLSFHGSSFTVRRLRGQTRSTKQDMESARPTKVYRVRCALMGGVEQRSIPTRMLLHAVLHVVARRCTLLRSAVGTGMAASGRP